MSTRPLHGLRVLVSGAGVAGPAAAYWLAAYGAEVTVVEIAPTLRTTGFAVDFRGETHLGVLKAMGVLDDLYAVQTHAGATARVDERDREMYRLPAEFAGGEVEVLRRDLSRILHDRAVDTVDYVFGRRIVELAQTPGDVRVTLSGGESRTVDLVIGADGIHSGVRGLAFGDESRYVRYLGHYLAHCQLPNDLRAGPVPRQYNVPGRMASVGADQRDPDLAGAFFVFASPQLDVDWQDLDAQKDAVVDAFAGLRWHVPRLLDGLRDASDIYFDAIAKVRIPQWHTDRVALLGDAAFGLTLGGMGVGTGIVGAYVLAGELAAANGDHRVAFPAYQRRLRGYADRWQRGANPGKFLAPVTRRGLLLRDALFGTKTFRRFMVASTRSLATSLDLPTYPTPGEEGD